MIEKILSNINSKKMQLIVVLVIIIIIIGLNIVWVKADVWIEMYHHMVALSPDTIYMLSELDTPQDADYYKKSNDIVREFFYTSDLKKATSSEIYLDNQNYHKWSEAASEEEAKIDSLISEYDSDHSNLDIAYKIIKHYCNAIDFRSKIVTIRHDVEAYIMLGQLQYELGCFYFDLRDKDNAISNFNSSIISFKYGALYDEDGNDKNFNRTNTFYRMGLAYNKLADCYTTHSEKWVELMHLTCGFLTIGEQQSDKKYSDQAISYAADCLQKIGNEWGQYQSNACQYIYWQESIAKFRQLIFADGTNSLVMVRSLKGAIDCTNKLYMLANNHKELEDIKSADKYLGDLNEYQVMLSQIADT